MTRKKNSFLTFCFSLLPGAGQMYMGFMQRGLSLMAGFFLIIIFGAWLNIGPILFILPLIWFYAFFDTHNLRSMSDEEFYAIEDDYLFLSDIPKEKLKVMQSKYRNIIAFALIILGFTVLWNNLFEVFQRFIPYYIRNLLHSFGYRLPQMVIGAAIILFGVYLIRGKQVELKQEEKKPEEVKQLTITSIPNDKEEGVE